MCCMSCGGCERSFAGAGGGCCCCASPVLLCAAAAIETKLKRAATPTVAAYRGLFVNDAVDPGSGDLAVRRLVVSLVVTVLPAVSFVLLVVVVRGPYASVLRLGLARGEWNYGQVVVLVFSHQR